MKIMSDEERKAYCKKLREEAYIKHLDLIEFYKSDPEKYGEELWEWLPGFEGFYKVSNWGRLKSFKRDKVNGKIKKLNFTVCLKANDNNRINIYYHVWQNNKPYFFLVNRKIYEIFNKTKIKKGYEVDHIDRNPLNNHISNLRELTSSENKRNTNKYKNCSSKYRGVSFNKNTQKWECNVYLPNIKLYQGLYINEEDAGRKYNEVIMKYNEENGTDYPINETLLD